MNWATMGESAKADGNGGTDAAERQASFYHVQQLLTDAYLRSEAEIASAAWREHIRRYPEDDRPYDHFPDPWPLITAFDENARKLGLTAKEQEERLALHRAIWNQSSLSLADPADCAILDARISLLKQWLERHPNDEELASRLHVVEIERMILDLVLHGIPIPELILNELGISKSK